MTLAGICFDLEDTLVDREAALSHCLDALARRFPGVLDGEALAELRALDAGGRNDRQAFSARAAARFPGLGSPGAFFAAFSDALVAAVRPRPEVSAAVAQLADRFRLAVISNGGARQREKLARAGLERHFPAGRVLVSGELGVEKPEPRIFELALAALALPAAEVLHVGDDPARDIVGAARAGIRSCWVSRGAVYPERLPPPGFTIAELAELPARLEDDRCAT